MRKFKALVLALAFNLARGHSDYWRTPNHLQPVHGLYIKPSTDGTTGDLYVAATEENGVKAQWLTDQPVNFVQTPAAQHMAQHTTQHATLPLSYLSSLTAAALPHDESIVMTQKRAVITSPAIKYAYALPVPGSPEGSAVPYPYALPSAPSITATSSETSTECSDNPNTSLAYPQYPYFYYPQMMAAFAHAMSSALKEVGAGDETLSSTAQPAQSSAMWPYSYPYPMQYVMMDPNAWARSLTAAAPATLPTTTESPAAPASDETT